MKLASIKDGSRDGQLAVVSRDLASAQFAAGIASTVQDLLDDWNFLSPQLEDLYATLNGSRSRHAFAFEPRHCMAPVPRAYGWVDGSAYLSHVELLRRAGHAEPPDRPFEEPLMVRGASDDFLGPCDDAAFAGADAGIDCNAALAVVTGDIAMGTAADPALEGVRLLMLANDWSLRQLAAAERATGPGLIQSKPATAFAPVAVTPDEVGDAWHGGRVHLWLETWRNGELLGRVATGAQMRYHFGQLLAHLAKTRNIRAGSIVGSGTVSSTDRSQGVCCIAERRAIETIDTGAAQTPFLQFGESLRIEVAGRDGQSVFGAIEQRVAPPPARA